MKKPKRYKDTPTNVWLERLYRRQLRMDVKLTRTMKTLADDFTRILRQNDTLRGEIDTLKGVLAARDKSIRELNQLRDADRFMSAGLRNLPPIGGEPWS
jgi:hypothetical protein